jgi:hypothetical protein
VPFDPSRYYAPTLDKFVPDPEVKLAEHLASTEGACLTGQLKSAWFVLKIATASRCGHGTHMSYLGIGLGTPGVSFSPSAGRNVAIGPQVEAGLGPVSGQGSVGFGCPSKGIVSVDGSINLGISYIPEALSRLPISGGAWMTWGCPKG